MGDLECQECSAPAEVTDTALMTGVDFDGEEAVFEVLQITCIVGHRYNEILGVVK